MAFEGAIVSGATLAGWRETSLDEAGHAAGLLRSEVIQIDLPLAPQMSMEELHGEFKAAEDLSATALDESGEGSVAYRDARAISERWRRAIAKQQTKALFTTADGGHFSCAVTLMQLGEIFFVAFPGEPYQVMQTMLRERCAGLTVQLAELCNQSSLDLGYLLPSDKVGQGTYQDELMSVKSGSLEMVVDRVSEKILQWSGEAAEMGVDAEVAEVARL